MGLHGPSSTALRFGANAVEIETERNRIRRVAGTLYFVDNAQSLPGEALDTLVPLVTAKRSDFAQLGLPGNWKRVESGDGCSTQNYRFFPDMFRTSSGRRPSELAPNAFRYNGVPQIGCQNQKVVEFQPLGTAANPGTSCVANRTFEILEEKARRMSQSWALAGNADESRQWARQADEFNQFKMLYSDECKLDTTSKLAQTLAQKNVNISKDMLDFASAAIKARNPVISQSVIDLAKQKTTFPGLVDAGTTRLQAGQALTQAVQPKRRSFPQIAPGIDLPSPTPDDVFQPPERQPQGETSQELAKKSSSNALVVAGALAAAVLLVVSLSEKGK